jgi:hypothetical protein
VQALAAKEQADSFWFHGWLSKSHREKPKSNPLDKVSRIQEKLGSGERTYLPDPLTLSEIRGT